MKKVLLPVIAGVIGVSLFYLGCEKTGVSINLTCVTKTTSIMTKVQSDILKELWGETEKGVVGITWKWTLKKPEGEGVVIERSEGDNSHFAIIDTVTPIDSVMTYMDTDTIKPDTKYYYRLSFLKDGELTPFDTVNLTTLSYLSIEKPEGDTLSISNDTLIVSWHRVKGIDNYRIQVYKGTDTTSLNKPLYDDTLTTKEELITRKVPAKDMPTFQVYVIKVTATRLAEYFTDTSEGLKAFFRIP